MIAVRAEYELKMWAKMLNSVISGEAERDCMVWNRYRRTVFFHVVLSDQMMAREDMVVWIGVLWRRRTTPLR